MSRHRYTEVRYNSWFSRMSNSITGIFVGAIMLLAAFPILFWNEGQSVKQHQMVKEAASLVVPIAPDRINHENEGKLVHMTGRVEMIAPVSDELFEVSSPDAIRLHRIVRMLQWKEIKETKEQKTVGGGSETVTTYTYQRVWSRTLIDSSRFAKPEGHQNPTSMPYEGVVKYKGQSTYLGAFKLTLPLIKQVENFEPMPLPNNTKIPSVIQNGGQVYDGGFYVSRDPESPEIGDMKIMFNVAKVGDVSVIAQQVGDSFQAHPTTNGDVELLHVGTHSAEDMLSKVKADGDRSTWAMRLTGFSLMWIALAMMLKPLSLMFDVLPILGNMVESGTKFIAFLLASILSTSTISIAWLAHRPIFAIGLICVAVGAGYVAKNRIGGRRFGRIIED